MSHTRWKCKRILRRFFDLSSDDSAINEKKLWINLNLSHQ